MRPQGPGALKLSLKFQIECARTYSLRIQAMKEQESLLARMQAKS